MPGPPTRVLVVNLGTPEAPTPAAVRAFLEDFLSDPLVVEGPRWLWLPLLHGVILRRRPEQAAALYEKIWTERGSPLATGTTIIGDALGAALPDADVQACYRYGSPNFEQLLTETAGPAPTRTTPTQTTNPRTANSLPANPQTANPRTANHQTANHRTAGSLPANPPHSHKPRKASLPASPNPPAHDHQAGKLPAVHTTSPRIVVVPLFFQRTGSSYGTIVSEARRIAEARGIRDHLAIATIAPDDPDYIAALAEQTHLALGEPVDIVERTQRAVDEGTKSTEVMCRAMELNRDEFPGLETEKEMRQSIDDAKAVLEWANQAVERAGNAVKEAKRFMARRPQRLLVSFHSIPISHEKREGTLYRQDCERTFRALLTKLHWPEDSAEITFQSRFGPAKWLGPATAERLAALGRDGIRRVAVIAPGFLTEGLETLEELDIRAAETFRAAGGEQLLRVPAVGAHPRLIRALERAVTACCS